MGFCIPKFNAKFCRSLLEYFIKYKPPIFDRWLETLNIYSFAKNFLMRLKGKREEDHLSTDSISLFRSMSMSQIKSILVIFVFCCMLYVFRFHEKFFLFIKQTISLDPLNLFCFSTFFQSQTIFHFYVFSIRWWMTLLYWMIKY